MRPRVRFLCRLALSWGLPGALLGPSRSLPVLSGRCKMRDPDREFGSWTISVGYMSLTGYLRVIFGAILLGQQAPAYISGPTCMQALSGVVALSNARITQTRAPARTSTQAGARACTHTALAGACRRARCPCEQSHQCMQCRWRIFFASYVVMSTRFLHTFRDMYRLIKHQT